MRKKMKNEKRKRKRKFWKEILFFNQVFPSFAQLAK